MNYSSISREEENTHQDLISYNSWHFGKVVEKTLKIWTAFKSADSIKCLLNTCVDMVIAE